MAENLQHIKVVTTGRTSLKCPRSRQFCEPPAPYARPIVLADDNGHSRRNLSRKMHVISELRVHCAVGEHAETSLKRLRQGSATSDHKKQRARRCRHRSASSAFSLRAAAAPHSRVAEQQQEPGQASASDSYGVSLPAAATSDTPRTTQHKNTKAAPWGCCLR